MTPVLVTGATGTVGSAVVRELRERDVAVRAFVRDPAKATALDGVDRLFLACGNVPGQIRCETSAVDAAAAAGVRHIVKLSAHGAEAGSPLAFWDWHGRIERHLAQSGVHAAVLRPASYMTNLLGSADAIAHTGMLFAPAGGARVAMIDPRDVATVAAVALTEGGHDGQGYALTGPAALSYDEIAAALSDATGRTATFVDIDEATARQGMREAGLPGFVVDFLVALFEALRAGAHAVPTDTVRAVTGSEPRSIAAFARDHAAALGGVATG
jgi:uncharacterized protein YbjT (DUF2867 family)